MRLSDGEVHDYRNEGFVLLEGRFSASECAALRAAADALMGGARDERILEPDGTAVRSLYNLHKDSARFGQVIADPRLVSPARQVLGDEIYVHQTQLNPKAAFVGEIWDWHQDFFYWHRDDGMPLPRATNVVLYLDAMTVFNGPLFLIPRTHLWNLDGATSTVSDGWESTLGRELKHVVSRPAVSDAVERFGMAAPLGPAGSVLLFDPRLLHASPSNVSPHERTTLFVRYNHLSNRPRASDYHRPEWLVERDPRPIVTAPRPVAG